MAAARYSLAHYGSFLNAAMTEIQVDCQALSPHIEDGSRVRRPPADGQVYSQPWAFRTASMRLRAVVFWMADDR
jgi:hypothetical protein